MNLGSLYENAIAGQADAISKLEKIADDLDDDWTILHYECRDGNTRRVRFIVEQFASKYYLVKVDKLNNTPLHVAAYHGRTAVVKFLIDAAAKCMPSFSYWADDDEDAPISRFQDFVRQANKNRNTALHLAVIRGNADIVNLLVEADPGDRHILNGDGVTPLYLACSYWRTDIIKIICTTCTAPSLYEKFGSTALHAVVLRPFRRDVLQLLIDAAKRSRHESFEAILDKPNQNRKTVLEEAVLENNYHMVELILAEHPAYQHERLSNSYTKLIPLIDMAVQKKNYDMVKLLCTTYDTAKPSVYNNEGLTVLLAAFRNRDKEFVIRLLNENNDLVTYADDEGLTPLHLAVKYEFDSVLEVLVKVQESIRRPFVYRDKEDTPLWSAVSKGYTSTVIRLLQVLPPSSYNKTGMPYLLEILHMAVSQSNKEMIRSILNLCPEEFIDKILNFKMSSCGNDTPLHVLIRNGCFVPELIKHKRVDRMAKNDQNWTPLDLLYLDDEIIAEQVLIKYALDTQEVNKGWKFWRRNIMGKSNTPESIVSPSQRARKDEKFKNAKNFLIAEERKRMMGELERYRKRTNTQIIVTALITTVTFTVGFTMPGGYHQSGEPDQGLVLLSKKTAFHVFMVSDALALALSITSLFIYFVSSLYEDPKKVSRFDLASTLLNIVSVIAMMLTFIAGIYVVLSHTARLADTVCIICSAFFLAIIVLLIQMIRDLNDVEKLKLT